MTIWTPRIQGREGPIYLAIAESLAEDIANGRVGAGDRLPTHRDLADVLGITVGTVTRAYREAEQRGLVVGEVGRGTFVRGGEGGPPSRPWRFRERGDGAPIDLGVSYLRVTSQEHRLGEAVFATVQDGAAADLLSEYAPQAGLREHRQAGVDWIARAGLEVPADRVMVCCGAQHALLVVLAGLCRPGDALVVDSTTYPTLLALAREQHLVVHGVAMDEDGMMPDALASACRAHKPRALYCMPNLHNPRSTVMTPARRRELVDVAVRHKLAIIEDDVYGFLLPERAPTMVAGYERGYFVTSCSKSMAPGLRIGWLALPHDDTERFLDALWASTVMAPPLMAEIARRWIASGTADALVEERRREAAARQAIARELLDGETVVTHPQSLHLWLELPTHWTSATFVAAALQRGVVVVAGDSFAPGRLERPAVRVSLGAARDQDELRRGLTIVRAVARGSTRACVV